MTAQSDMVVVGGGVIGCAVAYFATQLGLDVTLVDIPKRGRATSASAGGTWPLGESVGLGCGVIFYKALMARAGNDSPAHPPQLPASFLDFALASNAMFPALAAELRECTDIDVEFERTTLLFLMYDDGDEAFAHDVLDRYPAQQELMEWLTPGQVAAAEPALTRDLRGALRFHTDDQLNPYRFADALRAGARHHGATVITHTPVVDVEHTGRRVTGVRTPSGTFGCDVVVNAAGAWASEVARMAGTDVPVTPVRGQIVCTQTLPETLTACISTSDCYLAQKKHGEIIIGSTTEEVGFDTGTTASAMASLTAGAIRAVPALERVEVKRVWAGLRPGTPDELPILGPAEGLTGYLNACGHFRTGILNAPLTGLMTAEMATGLPPSYPVEPFLAARPSLLSATAMTGAARETAHAGDSARR
ncbi:MAG TPA: FAD-dependent oxidoreductase [Streptosporangiaceae bacterium]|nr:FAD-dependent oxidoreductase [Streptosporangiaceae bacterium]